MQVQLSYVASDHIVHSAAMHVAMHLCCCLQSCSIQEGKVGHYHDRVYTVKHLHRCVDVPSLAGCEQGTPDKKVSQHETAQSDAFT